MLERFTWFKQSAYRWDGDGRVVYIDPWGLDDAPEPADVVFITHAHYDHFDRDDLAKVRQDSTLVVAPRDVASELSGWNVIPVAPGETFDADGLGGGTVPAYNIVEHRLRSHPKDRGWVGYVLELGGTTCYFSGDTDHLPELEEVRADAAFVCVGNADFTMGPEEAADLVKTIHPEVAVPNHYGYECGSPADAEAFEKAADPVRVQILTPVRPYQLT